MECMSTSPTPLIRQLTITPHNTIANCTLRLSLHRAFHIALERSKRIDQAAVEYGDGTETGAQPGLPLLLVNGDAIEAFDAGVGQREGGGEGDAHGCDLLIESVGGGYLLGAWGDFDAEEGVRLSFDLGVGPVLH
jgi:hypothetical protein